MTKDEYHAIVENYDLYRAMEEANQIPSKVNRNGEYYRQLLRAIERKWKVTL